MSLATLATKDGLISLAGVNSSIADQRAGRNEHLRVFSVKYPRRPRRNSAVSQSSEEQTTQKNEPLLAEINTIGQSTLFKPVDGTDQYQRLLKLSPARKVATGSKRVGAIATGMSARSQLIVFDATKTPVHQAQTINALDLEEEANDLDIIDTITNEFSVVWCSDYSIYEQSITYNFESGMKTLTPPNPRRIYSLEKEDGLIRSKFRCVRFLTGHHILALSNIPNRGGTELSIIHLYPTGPASIVYRWRLPSHVKQAAAMDVCVLDADKVGSRQFVIAISSQDLSITIVTTNYVRQTDSMSNFRRYTTMRDVHVQNITGVSFAPFYPPDKPTSAQQYIRLASGSVGNTVVVSTLPLRFLNSKKSNPRYVLSHPSEERWTQLSYTAIITVLVLFVAILLQSYLFPGPNSAVTRYLPTPLRSMFDNNQLPASFKRLSEIVNEHSYGVEADGKKSIVITDSGLGSANTGLDVKIINEGGKAAVLQGDKSAKKWDDLAKHEKKIWKERLIEAGLWTTDESEAVLKGVIFSSLAHIVGGAVADALGH